MPAYSDPSDIVTFKQANAPAGPTDGDLWLDTSKDPATLKQYDGGGWVKAISYNDLRTGPKIQERTFSPTGTNNETKTFQDIDPEPDIITALPITPGVTVDEGGQLNRSGENGLYYSVGQYDDANNQIDVRFRASVLNADIKMKFISL